MNRQEKQITVAQVQKDLQASSAFFVVGVKSLTVREMLALRTALRAENARMQVVKNTLSLQALSAAGSARGMEDVLRNQVALIFAQADPAGVARELCNYAKK